MTNLFLLISYLLALSFAEPVRARRKLQDFWGTTQEPPEYCPMDRMVREVDECTDASATDNCACYEAIEYAIENGFNEMGYGCITPSGATFKQELSYCIYGVYEVVAPCFEEGPYVVDHPTLPFQVCAMSPDTIDDGYGYCYTNDDRWYIGDSCREYDNYDNLCPYDPPQVGKRCWDTEEGCYYGDWVCCCDDCRQMQYVSCSGEGGWISTMDASCSNDCAPVIHDSCNEDLIVSISWHYSEEVQQSCLEMPYGCLCLTTIMDAIHHGLEDLDPGCYTRSGLTFEEEALLCDGDGEVCIDHLRYYAHRCADGTLFNSNIGSVAACSAKASELGMASFNYRESNGKCIVPNNNDNCMEDTLISQNNNWDIYQIYCEIPKCPIEVPWTTEPCVDESLDCYYGEIVCCCDACRPTMVKSCSINFDWISYMDESCDDECTPITYDMCNIYLIESIGHMYDSPIPEECTDLGQPDALGGGSLQGCECYRTIADAVDHGLDFDMSCMMRTGKTFEEEVQSCPPDDTGSSYCTHAPDYGCYVEGFPACCTDSDIHGCPVEKPVCDIECITCTQSVPSCAAGCQDCIITPQTCYGCPVATCNDAYRKTSGFCSNIGCEVITSVDQCNVAASALGLPDVSVSHDGGRLPGCFLYLPSSSVEFNNNLLDTTDWSDTDSICYCIPEISVSSYTGRQTEMIPYIDLSVGSDVFFDRPYHFTSIGTYESDCYYVKGSNDDKGTPEGTVQWTMQIPFNSMVYVDFWGGDAHVHAFPLDGWTLSDKPSTSYTYPDFGPGFVYEKFFTAGTVELMGNDAGVHGLYYAFVCPRDNIVSVEICDMDYADSPTTLTVKFGAGIQTIDRPQRAATYDFTFAEDSQMVSLKTFDQEEDGLCIRSVSVNGEVVAEDFWLDLCDGNGYGGLTCVGNSVDFLFALMYPAVTVVDVGLATSNIEDIRTVCTDRGEQLVSLQDAYHLEYLKLELLSQKGETYFTSSEGTALGFMYDYDHHVYDLNDPARSLDAIFEDALSKGFITMNQGDDMYHENQPWAGFGWGDMTQIHDYDGTNPTKAVFCEEIVCVNVCELDFPDTGACNDACYNPTHQGEVQCQQAGYANCNAYCMADMGISGEPCVEDIACAYGIYASDADAPYGVCCDLGCGGCGGANCGALPGGNDLCCIGRIISNARECSSPFDTGCVMGLPDKVAVTTVKYSNDFSTTCQGNMKADFLVACTAAVSESKIWCYDCTEGSTQVTYVGVPSMIEEFISDSNNYGEVEPENYPALEMVRVVDTPDEVIEELEGTHSDVEDVVPENACCMALTLPCLACAADMTEEEYCTANPEAAVCVPTCDPCRVRRSWTLMSEADRAEYIDVITSIANGDADAEAGENLQQQYQDLIQMHSDNFGAGIHWAEEFLPWHRWYILQFEDLLRKVSPCITMPFWAWEMDAANAQIWTNNFVLWGAEDYELGSVTNPEGCVEDGKFGEFNFAQTNGACLVRGQSGTFDDLTDIQTNVLSVAPDNWELFTNALEGAHDGMHCTIDGTMCSDRSAEDPMFFLHHVNIDRLWSLWQDKGPAYKWSQQNEPNFREAMTAVSNHEAPIDFTDLSNQYGDVCAQYQDLSEAPEDPDDEAAGNVADVLNIINELPDDAEFWKTVPHTQELTLDNAKRFITNILVQAGGMSQEDAEAQADATLTRLGRTAYVEDRIVDDSRDEAHSAVEDIVEAILGTSTGNLRNALEEAGYEDEVAVLDFETETLERKYTDQDVCDPNPCENGATCETGYDGNAVCTCAAGYEGKSCHHPVCEPNPCDNGSCYVGADGLAACLCDEWYQGDRCEEEYCGLEENMVCDKCRCQQLDDTDHVIENTDQVTCRQWAITLGSPYYSFSSGDKCRIPIANPTQQCVDNIEIYKNPWNTYEVDLGECPTTTPPSGCEEAPIQTCDECRCVAHADDIIYNGFTLNDCFNWALFYELEYFSFSNGGKCRLPGGDPFENCVTNVETEYRADWDTYEIEYCTTTAAPTPCEGSYDLICDECRCNTQYEDIIVQPSTLEACHELARDNGKSYFSFNSANKCRIPMGDDEEADCVTNRESGKADWDLYQLTECATQSPCEQSTDMICDECRCEPHDDDIIVTPSTVEDCKDLAMANGNTYFSFSETNGMKCRVPGGDETDSCVNNVELYKGDWDLYEITECTTQGPTVCDDSYVELCDECRCLSQYDDEILQPTDLQGCFEFAQLHGATYFSLSNQGKCRVPTSGEFEACVTNVEAYKGDWTTYEIEDCITTTAEPPCDPTPTQICSDCRCQSHGDDHQSGYETYESCLAQAQAANAEYMWFNEESGRCRYNGGDGEEQCVENLELYRSGWIVWHLEACATVEPCVPDSEEVCSDCKCNSESGDEKDNDMTLQECHEWAISLGIDYYWYRANENKCRIPGFNAVDQCITNQINYNANNWKIYNVVPCGDIETCPPSAVLVDGNSCENYLNGLSCGVGSECCCGQCYDEMTATCDYGTWQLNSNDNCVDVDCECADEYPWKLDCKTIVAKGDCFGYYEHCADSCGCNFDLAQARIDAGINDELVETTACVNGNGFQDSRGFNCNVYEGAKWCAVEDGEIVEGEGWCSRWPFADYENVDEASCRVKKGRKRMYTFGHYVDNSGLDARTCCCNTGKADEYQYDLGWEGTGATCNDLTFHDGVAWHDKNGWTCRVYHFGNLCNSNGEQGAGWNAADWGTFRDNAFIDTTLEPELDATQACCSCGGGVNNAGYVALDSGLVKKINKRFAKQYSNKNFNRMLKHTQAMLDHHTLYGDNYDPDELDMIRQMRDIGLTGASEAKWNNLESIWDASAYASS